MTLQAPKWVTLGGVLAVLSPNSFAAREGEVVRMPIAASGYSLGEPGVAPHADGWLVVSDGSPTGCDSGGSAPFANYRWAVDHEGDPTAPVCSPRLTNIPYEWDKVIGGSLTTTESGFAYVTMGLLGYQYVETFGHDLAPLRPVTVIDSGYVSAYDRAYPSKPSLTGTSRAIIHLEVRNLPPMRWAAKRRLESDGSGRSLDGALNPGTNGTGLRLPGTDDVAGAWDGERAAVVWPETDWLGYETPRLRLRFLDADSQALGSTLTVAKYDRGTYLGTVSIASTPHGWVVSLAKREPGESDTWLFLLWLDKEGALLRVQRLSHLDEMFPWDTNRSHKIAAGENGSVGLLYLGIEPNQRLLQFLELDERGAVLNQQAIPDTDYYEINASDISFSRGRWGLTWRDARFGGPSFCWFDSRLPSQ